MDQPRVLVVDDDRDFAETLLDILTPRGIRTRLAYSGSEARQAAEEFRPDVALLDVRLGQDNGLDLLQAFQSSRPDTLCVMVTAYGDLETAITALQQGAYDYLRKPVNPQELLATLARCFETLDLRAAQRRTLESLKTANSRLKTLRQVDRALLAAHSTEEIASATLRRLHQMLGAKCSSLLLFDRERDEARVLAAAPENAWPPGETPLFPLGELSSDMARLEAGPFTESGPAKDGGGGTPARCTLQFDVGSRTVVPLRSPAGLIGVLYLGFERLEDLEPALLEIAVEVAEVLSLAVERAELLRETEQGRQRLKQLSSHIDQAEEKQRRGIARELHDRVGQNLTALSLGLRIISNQTAEAASVFLQERIQDCLRLVDETGKQIRDVMDELRPEVLDQYGLHAAMEWHCAIFAKRTGLEATVDGEEFAPRLPLPVETLLFRLAQEALTNAAKHARASHVWARFAQAGGVSRFEVGDDGLGLPVAGRDPDRQGTGWGMDIMRERAEAAGGRFHMESSPGGGTRVIVELGSSGDGLPRERIAPGTDRSP